MARVVKQIRQKINTDPQGGITNFTEIGQYPLGIDGIYADMFSGLNLEEQLKLGGPKETSITQSVQYITITEKYYRGNSNTKYYLLETKINKLTETCFLVNNNRDFLINNEDKFLTCWGEKVDVSDTVITITLFYKKPDQDLTPLRIKTITFEHPSNSVTNIVQTISDVETEV